jgi:hypothetical protein
MPNASRALRHSGVLGKIRRKEGGEGSKEDLRKGLGCEVSKIELFEIYGGGDWGRLSWRVWKIQERGSEG